MALRIFQIVLLLLAATAWSACALFEPETRPCKGDPRCTGVPVDAAVGKGGREGDAGGMSGDAGGNASGSGGRDVGGTGGKSGTSGITAAGHGAGGAISTGGVSAGRGGSAGSSGGALGADAGPCGKPCSGAKPVCNAASKACVECLIEDDCASVVDRPACDTAKHACVGCTQQSDCDGTMPVCNTDNQTCVECNGDDDCDGARPDCDLNLHGCVECNQSSSCKDATKSRCAANACLACGNDNDCTHIPGKPVCDGGACVECTGSKYAACGKDSHNKQLVCDSKVRTCSTSSTERSTGLCGSCIADAQCFDGQLCVQDAFGSPPVNTGYFCFWKKNATGSGAPANNCDAVQPFVGAKTEQSSIDGTMSDICGLRVSTCAGYNAFSSAACESQSSPGSGDDSLCDFTDANTPDAYCRTNTSGNHYCTMPCGSDLDCKTGFACNTQVAPNVCSL